MFGKEIFNNKEKTQKFLDIFVFIFLIIQPIFDLKIFYNSISTLIRVIIIGVLFLFYFFLSTNKKKYWLALYPTIILIYFIFHHINSINFNSLVPGNFNYSIFTEILYFVKMITPFLLIYILYKSNLKYEKIFNIIRYIVLIIGLIIIISNIFMFSYGSYSDQIIKANFFSWFSNTDYTYQDLASKGLFEYANQIGAILLMFLPFCLLQSIREKNIINILTLLINILSLFLLGTKVSVLGIFIVFVYTITIYVFYKKIIVKNKLPIVSFSIPLIILLCYSLIISNNPIFMRIDETKTIEASSTAVTEETIKTQAAENNNENAEINIIENNNLDLLKYIEENYKEKQIKEEFITQSYPYQYDTEFWLNIFDEPLCNRVDYRFIEEAMIKRVIELNNNKYDIVLGISNTRVQNIFNIERDFVVQYYALGIIGIIIIFLPYFVFIFKYICNILTSKFKTFTLINSTSFITIIMVFCISYLTGNLLNSLSFTIYFALLFNLIIKNYED